MRFFALAKNADGIIGPTSATGIGAIALRVRLRHLIQGEGKYLGLFQSTAVAGLADTLANIGVGMRL